MTPDEMLTRVRELWTLLQRERDTSKRYHVLAKEIRHLADAYKAAERRESEQSKKDM